MPSLKDKFLEVEPCTNFDALQIIGEYIIEKTLELKQEACQQATDIFADLGLENFEPCMFIDEEFLASLQEQKPVDVMQTLLATQGFPPHLIDFLRQGPTRLEIKKYQNVIKWSEPLIGIQVHEDTAQYIRDAVTPKENRILDQGKTQAVQNFYIRQGVTEVQGVVQEKLTTFINSKFPTPTPEEVKQYVTVLNNIQKVVNNVNDKFEKFQEKLEKITTIINILNSITQLLDKVTVINSTVTIPALAATPTGVAAIFSDINGLLARFITRYKDDIKTLDNRICNLYRVTEFVAINLGVISAILATIEALLRALLETADPTALAELQSSTSLPYPVTLNRAIPPYRGYTLEIRQEQATEAAIADFVAEFNLPRYYAVALDPVGVVVLTGTPSFTSNTEVLIEELKFRIDNQLG